MKKEMSGKEGRATSDFELPETVLAVLPADPFEQLDVARKITSIALATRISNLESEASGLRQKVAEKDEFIADLQQELETLDAALADASDKLAKADDEKEGLLNENATLSNTVKKLQRDVSKLEIFRKTLVQSLQEEEEAAQAGAPKVSAKQMLNAANASSGSQIGVKTSSVQNHLSGTGSSFSEGWSGDTDASRSGASHGLLLASHSSTPKLTPPESPLRLSTCVSPTRLSKPVSPRRHSISFSSTKNFDERASVFSSMPSSHHSSISGPLETGSQTGRSRVDGKEFFRQVRSRLSYEQFGAFLSNVKDLNSHKKTREETLKTAEEIFGPDNKDLYTIFEGLIARNLHS